MMIDQYVLFIVVAPPALATSVLIAAYTWRRRKRPLSCRFFLMMIPVCGYLATNILEFTAPSLALKVLCAKATYVFAPSLCIAWLAFSFDYSGMHDRLALKRFWPFFVIPALTTVFALTNELHQLIWKSTFVISPVRLRPLSVTYGYWFWVNIVYSYGLLIAGAAITAREYLRSLRSYRRQSALILVGMIVPMAFQIVYVFRIFPSWNKDYTPIGFAITGIAFAVGIFKYRLLGMAPIARSLILDRVSEGICVLDDGGNILDLNLAMLRIIGGEAEDLLGRQAADALPFPLDSASCGGAAGAPKLVELTKDGARLRFELSVVELARPKRGSLGRLITLHDVTERERLMAEVERLAVTDPLTGLYNRRYFDARAREEVERAERLGQVLSVFMMDLDDFKRINDEFGHSVGDEVLISTASLMQRSFRRIDILARYGGEEFVALVPGVRSGEAFGLAERLRSCMAECPRHTSAGDLPITVSIGLDDFSESSRSLESLIRRADAAMYAAKKLGKNRVVGADEIEGADGAWLEKPADNRPRL